MNDKELDKLFSDQLKPAEATPDAALWDRIEKELDRSAKKTVIRKLSWVKYAAVLAVVFGTSLGLYFYRTDSNTALDRLAQQTEKQTIEMPSATGVTVAPRNETDFTAVEQETPVALVASAVTKPHNKKAPKQMQQPTETAEEPILRQQKLSLPVLVLATVTLAEEEKLSSRKVMRRKVVEIDPIQPLVLIEEEDSMLASNTPASSQNIVTGILNKLSTAINSEEDQVIRFSHDEEGSFRIDIKNSFAKNRFKRKK